MKNKVSLKKFCVAVFLATICLSIMFLFLNIYEYKIYTKNFNNKISMITSIVKNKYPQVSDKEIIEILNNDKKGDSDFFKKYGIDIEKDTVILANENKFHTFLIINLIYLWGAIIILILIFIKYNHKKEKDIEDIIKQIEQINKRNYELKIDSNSEDELSILKDEIYKTTIMLKEAADNSNKDKINLKKSLEDISHQLKTPLTSVLVMLDNIIEDPDMDEEVKKDFIIDIKRNVVNINFLVQAILKLSKFDSNTINFIKEENKVKDIVDEAIKNVLPLCDLKNIDIDLNVLNDSVILSDFRWQVEAITNILKNAVDHSLENNKVTINIDSNNVYSLVEIINYGKVIDKKDLKHIFERFYKGKNAKADSIGIGLALAKSIVEEDNGNISVESNDNETKFILKYFKI